jgi:anti-anti-sigma factor
MKHPISISRALGHVVVTVHGEPDAQLLHRALQDLAEDQGNLRLVLDLKDADPLDRDSVAVIARSSRRVRHRGGELVLSTPPLASQDTLRGHGLTIAGP